MQRLPISPISSRAAAAVLLLAFLPQVVIASSIPGTVGGLMWTNTGDVHCVLVTWNPEDSAESYQVEFQLNGFTSLYTVYTNSITLGVPRGETGRVRVRAISPTLQNGSWSGWLWISNSGIEP